MTTFLKQAACYLVVMATAYMIVAEHGKEPQFNTRPAYHQVQR